jgi:putative endonuclease
MLNEILYDKNADRDFPQMTKAPNNRKEFGTWGEELAYQYLIENGVSIIDRNVHTPYGEIDLVGELDGLILFVEVKTRRNDSFGFPEESINKKKAEHMVNSAMAYIQKRSKPIQSWRIDVVAILINEEDSIDIKWFKNAVSG